MSRNVTAFIAAVALSFATAPVFSADSSPLAGGRTLYEQKCVTCHSLERSLAVQADRAGWESQIKRMIANGAALDEAQSGQIIDYLNAKSAFETKCNGCHNLQKPLTAIMNPEQWQATVAKMAATLSETDAGAIAHYLALVTPVAPAAPAAK